jgi:serine phosphatase RsbU (regulator of sigma subunit)
MAQDKHRNANRFKNFQRFYHLYKSDLSLNEIEKLVKRDVPGLYDFYARDMEKPDKKQHRVIRYLTFTRNFFLSFLLKLTAARRLFYSVAFILFFYGLFSGLDRFMLIGFIVLNILLALEVADKLIVKDELEVARDIQMGLMPLKAPQNTQYDIACFTEPAREVGGDYYDFLQPKNNEDRTYIIVGDVKGKGMAAALYMVRVQALLHYLIDQMSAPKDILIALNHNIRRIMRKDYFISLAIIRVNEKGEFNFCRAGHMPLIHYRAKTKRCEILLPEGIAVGLENNGSFDRIIEEIKLSPSPGDVFAFYTDGVVETRNESNMEYGDDALQKIICESAGKSAERIKDTILTDLAKFRGKAPSHDDITLLVIKAGHRKPK